MGVMANPFYVDMGFTLQQIANVTKIYGFVMSMAGRAAGRRRWCSALAPHGCWRPRCS